MGGVCIFDKPYRILFLLILFSQRKNFIAHCAYLLGLGCLAGRMSYTMSWTDSAVAEMMGLPLILVYVLIGGINWLILQLAPEAFYLVDDMFLVLPIIMFLCVLISYIRNVRNSKKTRKKAVSTIFSDQKE